MNTKTIYAVGELCYVNALDNGGDLDLDDNQEYVVIPTQVYTTLEACMTKVEKLNEENEEDSEVMDRYDVVTLVLKD